jgi:phosphotransferase system HPr-like phosphotransfer protein
LGSIHRRPAWRIATLASYMDVEMILYQVKSSMGVKKKKKKKKKKKEKK